MIVKQIGRLIWKFILGVLCLLIMYIAFSIMMIELMQHTSWLMVIPAIVAVSAFIALLHHKPPIFARSLAWLFLISIAAGLDISIMNILAKEQGISTANQLEYFSIYILIWICLVRYNVPFGWAFLIVPALALHSMVMRPGLAISIVLIIGSAKLVIQCIGRRNVLARSRISVDKVEAPPKGMIE